MQEQLIKLAKEKHFEGYFKKEWEHNTKESLRYYFWMCELQKWLREIHNIGVIIQIDDNLSIHNFTVYLIINKAFSGRFSSKKYYDTYENALEIGLYEALKSI